MNITRKLKRRYSRVAFPAVLLALCAAGTAVPAHANVVWFLENAQFDDGTFATGSFTFDDGYANVLDVNIAVTAGSLPAFVYNLGSISFAFGDDFSIDVSAPNSLLILGFSPHLPLGGGTRNLDLTLSHETDNQSTSRFFDAGQVTTDVGAPEPSLGWMTALLACLACATSSVAPLRARVRSALSRQP